MKVSQLDASSCAAAGTLVGTAGRARARKPDLEREHGVEASGGSHMGDGCEAAVDAVE
jgi:hypothetical protein